MPKKTNTARNQGFDWSALTIAEQLSVLQIFANDGHTIYDNSYLLARDCPQSVITYFTLTHRSDRADPKTTITKNNEIVDSMNGVYGLTVLWSLARHYNIASYAMGRGFQAHDLTLQLYERLDPASTTS